uniref:B-cell receptor CD22-like n=1 Tax=Semicossyphus pulcher TaxID=241346 RepID=UPI0037E74EE8
MSLKAAAASGLVIVLLVVPVVQGETDWRVTYSSTQICALKGSTVDIPCTYTYPSTIDNRNTRVQSRLWFAKEYYYEPVDVRTDSDYTGRVQYLFHENDCTLRITDLRESDSAEYKFRFTTNQPGGSFSGSPGVSLSVTDLQVQVEGSSTQADLRCHSSCNVADNPSYVWFSNGVKMDEETSSLRASVNDENRYSCAVKGREDYRSPVVYGPKLPSVSVSPAEIVEGTPVTLTCSSEANPAATYTWYKDNEERGNQAVSTEAKLVFSSIQASDSGKYYCAAGNRLGRTTSVSTSIDVKYGPKLPSVSVSPSAEIVEGSSVTLTCSSDAKPAAKCTWYRENQTQPLGPERSYHFTSISSDDRRNYYCKCANNYGEINSSLLFVDVQYGPKPLSVSVSPSAEIVEGSSVTLTCSSDAKPAAKCTWYRENQTQPLGPERSYHFTSISSDDSRNYYCKCVNNYGEINSSLLFVDVQYAPKPLSVSVSPSAEIVEGSSVTLTCSSEANPPANYTWIKEHDDSPKASGHIFTISNPGPEHSGNYYCEAKNTRGRSNSTVHLTVVADSLRLHPTEDVLVRLRSPLKFPILGQRSFWSPSTCLLPAGDPKVS